MNKPFTARKAAKMVKAGEARYAFFAVGPDGIESRAKPTLDAANAVYPEGGHTVITRLAVNYMGKVHSHNNAVGAQIFTDKSFTMFVDIT